MAENLKVTVNARQHVDLVMQVGNITDSVVVTGAAKLERRFTSGLYALNSFTWSKSIDNTSGHLEAQNGDNSRVNFRDIESGKGLSGYDQPFNNTTSFVWDLPLGRGRKFATGMHPVLEGILGGWRLTGINTMTSGISINLSYSPTTLQTVSDAPTYRPIPRNSRRSQHSFGGWAFYPRIRRSRPG